MYTSAFGVYDAFNARGGYTRKQKLYTGMKKFDSQQGWIVKLVTLRHPVSRR
jgi:hypothetical protein